MYININNKNNNLILSNIPAYFKTLASPTLCINCNEETFSCSNKCGYFKNRCGKSVTCTCSENFECVNGKCQEIDTLQNETYTKEIVPINKQMSIYGFHNVSLSAHHLLFGFEINSDDLIIFKNNKIQDFNYNVKINAVAF